MAIVNFYDDILGEVSKTEKVRKGQSLRKIINKYIEEKESITVPFEVYDMETGETSFVQPETNDYKTLCLVNGNETTDLEYIIKPGDIVNFVIIPESDKQWWSYLGGAVLIAAGALLSYFTCGVGAVIGVGLVMSGIGLMVNQAFTDITSHYSDEPSKRKSKTDSLKEAENTLGLSDGSNQNILDHRYPVVLGKHLVNPYVVGSGYNTTLTEENGIDGGQYLTKLFAVGYGPLKLTDFKLGETLLAYNRTFESTEKNTIMHGLLQGWNEADTGDILKKWKNNNVSIEILQAGTLLKDDNNKYGTLYPQTVEQLDVGANILNIKDGDIKSTAVRSYLGASVPNGFKTNSVRFSRACPQRIEVELNFPNGLFAYRTRKEDGTIFYYNLPVSFVVQWRFVTKGQKSSDADSTEGWNNFDYIDITNGQDIRPKYYTRKAKLYEYNSMWGKRSYLNSDDLDSMSEFFSKDKFINSEVFNLNGRYTAQDESAAGKVVSIRCLVGGYFHPTGVGKMVWSKNEVLIQTIAPSTDYYKVGDILTKNSQGFLRTQPRVDYYTREAKSSGGYYSSSASNSSDKIWTKLEVTEVLETDDFLTFQQLIKDNRDNISNHSVSKNDINVSARNYVAVKEFTPAECAKLVSYKDNSGTVIDRVEVRVIRLTPSYFAETAWSDPDSGESHSIDGDWTGMTYNDLMKWVSLRTFSFDKDKFIEQLDNGTISLAENANNKDIMRRLPLRPVSEDDLNRFCFVAIKLKQDIAETAGKSLSQLSCIAQNLAPNYDTQAKQWMPAVITKKEHSFHKHSDKIEDISSQEYLDAIRQRKTFTIFVDGTSVTTNSVKSNNIKYFLSEKGLEYSKIKTPGKDFIFCIDGTDYTVDLTNIYALSAGERKSITEDIYVSTGKGDTLEGLYIQKTGNSSHSIYVYQKDSTIKPSEYYQTAAGNDFADQIKAELFNYSTLANDNSNAELKMTSRPAVSGSVLNQNGYSADSSKTYTLFAKKYTNEKILNTLYPSYAVVVTPIKPDGTVLSSAQLDAAADKLLRRQADENNILLQSFVPAYAIKSSLSLSGNKYYYIASVSESDAAGDDNYYLSEQAGYYIQIAEKIQEIYNNPENEYYEKLQALSATAPEDIQLKNIKNYAKNIGLSYDFDTEDKTGAELYKTRILETLYKTTFVEAVKQVNLVAMNESEQARFYLPEYVDEKYCSQNTASQFLYALVGPALGIDAKTYDDVNMDSISKLYNFCSDVTDGTKGRDGKILHFKFTCNACIASEVKFDNWLYQILLTGRSLLKRDEENRYEVVIGKPVDYPVGVINQQNIIAKSNSRSFAEEVSGYLVNFVDESDNYTQNSIYIMNDGEDYRKPTKEIGSLSLNYVTNREQVYSLGRYTLCTVLYQKETYSYTIGAMGYAISVGDVLLLQDDSLLVGKESGARITSLITNSDGKKLYGITFDSPVEFTGESGFGCTIVQPEKYGASRCVTLKFCGKDGLVIDDGNRLVPQIGITNTLYFDEVITIGAGTDSETGKSVQVAPKIGNLVAFGNVKAITEKVLVLGVSPKEKGQFELKLVPYKPELYNMGSKLPVFTANMTIPSRAEDEIPLSDKSTIYEQEQKVADATASLTEKIEAISKNIDVTPPTPPVLTDITSDDEGNITLVWSGSTDTESGVAEYCIYHKLAEGRFARLQTVPHNDSSQSQYTYTHITADKFTSHYYYVTAKDKMSNESEPSETLSIKNPVKTLPNIPSNLAASAYENYITLGWTAEQSASASLNPRSFKVEVKRSDESQWEAVGETTSGDMSYYFDRSVDGYPEADAVSAYKFRVKSVSVYGLESDWCTLESVKTDSYLGWKIGGVSLSAYATEGMLYIRANIEGSSYGEKRLSIKYGDVSVAENVSAGRLFYYRLEGYQEASDITAKGVTAKCTSVADSANASLPGDQIDVSLYKTYKITKPNVTAYADKQGIHISWSDNSGDYYLAPVYTLQIDGADVLSSKDVLSFDSLFAEDTYPLKDDVAATEIKLTVSTDADSVEITDIPVDVSVFKGWIPEKPELKLSVSGRTVPLSWNTQSDNVYNFLGCDIQVAKGYKTADGKYSVITDESELEWFAPALGLNPYESLDNYKKGDKDGYLSVKGTSVAFSVPLFGQDTDGALSTMYVYRARAFTKGGKSEWSDAFFAEVKPVSAYDVVKAWDINDNGEKVKLDGALGANQIFVNELSAICANLGYITDGALQTDSFNYWAVNDTLMKDGSVLAKGSFRVGGADEYLEVSPVLNDNGIATGDYTLKIVAQKFSTTTNVTILNNKLFLVRDKDNNILFKAGVYEKNPDALDDYGLEDGDDKNYIRVNEGYYTSKAVRTLATYPASMRQPFIEKNINLVYMSAAMSELLGNTSPIYSYKDKIYYITPGDWFTKISDIYDPYFTDKNLAIYSVDLNNNIKKEFSIPAYPLGTVVMNGSLLPSAFISFVKGFAYYTAISYTETDITQDFVRLSLSTGISEKVGNGDEIPNIIKSLFGSSVEDTNFIEYRWNDLSYISLVDEFILCSYPVELWIYKKEADNSSFERWRDYYDKDGNAVSVTNETYKSGTYYTKDSNGSRTVYFLVDIFNRKAVMCDEDIFSNINGWNSDDNYLYFCSPFAFGTIVTRVNKTSFKTEYCAVRISQEPVIEGEEGRDAYAAFLIADSTLVAKGKFLKLIKKIISFVGTYTVINVSDDGFSVEKQVYTGILEVRNPIWADSYDNVDISTLSIYGENIGPSIKVYKSLLDNDETVADGICYLEKSIYTPLISEDENFIFASKAKKSENLYTYGLSSVFRLKKTEQIPVLLKNIEILGTIEEESIQTDFKRVPLRPLQILNIKQLSEGNFFIYAVDAPNFCDKQAVGAAYKEAELKAGVDIQRNFYISEFQLKDEFVTTNKNTYETGIGFSGFYKDVTTKNYRYLLASGAYLEFDKSGKLVTDNRGDKGDKGDTGDKGAKGDKGDKGDPGVSVEDVKQTETSTEPGGVNRLEITLSDGTKSEFSVRNGSVSTDDIVLTDDDFTDILKQE